jgi:glycosyltransferase involved in cell wall biosynthesis
MNECTNSALSLDARVFLHDIEKADLLVGIPSYNNVLTASYVLAKVVEGLETYFPNLDSVIFVSDGKSKDKTLDSVKKMNLPSKVKLIPAIYQGASGKGTAVKAIFEAACHLNVRSVALVDSDLRSITPEWIHLLITPTLRGTDFVTPLYNRRKYDGTITNFLCYPVTASLFGKNIRQPIGGDFGLSIQLVEDLLNSPMWGLPEVSLFGIDIFETLTAIAKGYRIKQAYLGVKNHDAKDPSSMLGSMFRQVMNTMFSCVEEYESVWKGTRGVSEVEMYGSENSQIEPEAVQVSLPATIEYFKKNYDRFWPIYRSFLEQDIQEKFDQLKQSENMELDFPSEIWAKTVYSFIAEFHKEPSWGRDALAKALRVLWLGRVAVFLKETWDKSRDESEKVVIEEAKVFERLKSYLIDKY